MVQSSLCQLNDLSSRMGLDAILFTDLNNIRYLCGFTGTDGALILSGGRTIFLTDSRYLEQAKTQVRTDDQRQYQAKIEGVAEALAALGIIRIGFEAEHMTCAALGRYRERCGDSVEWVELGDDLRKLRCIKGQSELAAIEEATRIAQLGFEEVLPLIRPGAVESDIARELEFALRRLGGQEKSFDFIVASGPRGALPHGVASDRVIQDGELVTIDFGTVSDGFHSDETVTVAVGEVSPELQNIYDIVLEAHDRAAAALRPGVQLRDLDAIARDYITEKGYGEYFGHGLGHGVGLDVHEAPVLSPRSSDVAAENMVVTIEPGIYIPGLGGVRIEDMYVVTSTGARVLTRIPKNFKVLS